MYYSEKGPYKRGSGGQTITFENSAVLAHGHMDASTYHPLLNISVIPQGGRTSRHGSLPPTPYEPDSWNGLLDITRNLV